MKRALLAVFASFTLALGFAPAAHAGVFESDQACTSPFNEYTPNPQICVRVYYEDNGKSVTLRRILVWMKNPRNDSWEASAGYKFDDLYVKCVRNNGNVDYFFSPPTNAVVIKPDSDTYAIDPPNLNCGEDNVRYDGVGILAIHYAPDRQDDFGPESGYNTLPVD